MNSKIKLVTLLFIFCFFEVQSLKAQEFTVTLEKIAKELSQGIQNGKLKAVAIVDFADNQDVITELGKFLSQKTLTQMTKHNNSFSILNRDRLNYLLEENKLSVKKGLVDSKTAVKLGKVTGVDALVIGKITPLGSNGEKYDLSIQVVKLETLEVIIATEGTISNTPAMQDLYNNKISSRSNGQQASGSTSSNQSSASEKTVGDFKLRIKEAKQSGDAIKITFQILNNSDVNRKVRIYNDTYYKDSPTRINIDGDITTPNRIEIAGMVYMQMGKYTISLTSGIWINGELTFPIKNTEVTDISSFEISIFDYQENKNSTVLFKNIKL